MQKYLDIPLTLIVSAVFTVAMLLPVNQPLSAPEGTNKLMRLIVFAALAFPLARTDLVGLFPLFFGASVFGGLIEALQTTFGRSANVQGWIPNIIGAALGIALALVYRRLRKHRA